MASHIKDSNLWESGELKLSWVRSHMPLLEGIQKDFEKTQPFKGLKVALSVHLEAKRLGLKGSPRDQLPKLWPLVRDKGHLLLPLITNSRIKKQILSHENAA
jgi:hypothetical protein